jgi:NitT/TauT family transport system permease protein
MTDEVSVASTAVPTQGSRAKKPPRLLAWRLLGYASFLAIWAVAAEFLVDPNHLPSPFDIAADMWEILRHGDFLRHFWATAERTLICLPLVYVIGVAVGILMGSSLWFESFFRDFVTVLLSLPGLIVVLLFILIMGLDPKGPIIAIVITNFGFVTVQVWEGVKSLPAELDQMSKAFGVSRYRRLRHVTLPALAPFLFPAFTYAFTLTWKLAMVSELFGGTEGIGFRMRVEFWQFNVSAMVAWAMMLFFITLAVERLVLQRLERHVLRWREGSFT